MRGPLSTLLILAPFLSIACLGVSPTGEPLTFGNQEEIVIYNSKTKTEFFIRNARFESVSKDFGFIAPTPSEPELFAVSDEIFKLLQRYWGRMSRGTEEPVQIVKIENVGGYQATVIKATDPKALTNWLVVNKYATTPNTLAWVNHYVKKNWYFTAFKIINQAQVTESGIVGMKFKADTPFYPFFVPKDNYPQEPGSTLDCTFISDFQHAHRQIGDVAPKDTPIAYNSQSTVVSNEDIIKISSLLAVPLNVLPSPAFQNYWPKEPFPTNDVDDMFLYPGKPPFELPKLRL